MIIVCPFSSGLNKPLSLQKCCSLDVFGLSHLSELLKCESQEIDSFKYSQTLSQLKGSHFFYILIFVTDSWSIILIIFLTFHFHGNFSHLLHGHHHDLLYMKKLILRQGAGFSHLWQTQIWPATLIHWKQLRWAGWMVNIFLANNCM